LGDHLLDQCSERHDPGGLLTPAERPCLVDVVGGQVGQCPATVVVVVDPHHPGPARGQAGVAATTALIEVFVRHEALHYRMEVKGIHRRAVAAVR